MVHKSPDATIAALCKYPSPKPLDRVWLDKTVKDALKETPSSSSAELRRSKWELALKNEVFMLAVCLFRLLFSYSLKSPMQMKEGEALKTSDMTYYDKLNFRFDLMLSFTENGL
jgi:THO complex subunit 1